MASCPKICGLASARKTGEAFVTDGNKGAIKKSFSGVEATLYPIGASGKRKVNMKVIKKFAEMLKTTQKKVEKQQGGNGKRPGDKQKGGPEGKRPKATRRVIALCHALTIGTMMTIYFGIPMVLWPMVEGVLVANHLLPMLCTQNAAGHLMYSALSATGLVDSCATVFAIYQQRILTIAGIGVAGGRALGLRLASPMGMYSELYALIMALLGGEDVDDDELEARIREEMKRGGRDDEDDEGSGAGAAYEAQDPKGKKKIRGGKRRTRKRKGRKSRKQTKKHKKRKTKGHKKRKSRRTRKH